MKYPFYIYFLCGYCVTLDFQVFKLVMNAIAQWDGTTRAAFLNLWEKHKQQHRVQYGKIYAISFSRRKTGPKMRGDAEEDKVICMAKQQILALFLKSNQS